MLASALLLLSLLSPAAGLSSPEVVATAQALTTPARAAAVVAAQVEDEEPFPWDMLSGALMMSGGFGAGLGLTTAGAGALLLTAPGTDANLSTLGYVLAGAGAGVGVLSLVVASTGGGIMLFTSEDE